MAPKARAHVPGRRHREQSRTLIWHHTMCVPIEAILLGRCVYRTAAWPGTAAVPLRPAARSRSASETRYSIAARESALHRCGRGDPHAPLHPCPEPAPAVSGSDAVSTRHPPSYLLPSIPRVSASSFSTTTTTTTALSPETLTPILDFLTDVELIPSPYNNEHSNNNL
ncbi:hypothetical protein BC628DRAFT_907581 [Trametes gibbosa]|nr:hypothetical protein BC628DRAFT_907581 [Trametes gibbosa]